MFITSRVKCALCGQPFKEGDCIKVLEEGVVEKIGGLGLYKDQLTLRSEGRRAEHVMGSCPSSNTSTRS